MRLVGKGRGWPRWGATAGAVFVAEPSGVDRKIARVISTLILADGRQVHFGARTEGGSKNHTRYGVLDGGCSVVVKVQATHGQLRREEAALIFVAGQGLPTPSVVGSGTTADGDFFLVLSHEPGTRTHEPEGWQRMGREYARLADTMITDCPLPVIGPAEFADDHARRLDAVSRLLGDRANHEIREAIKHFGRCDELALTHGDPGSGNYLDHHCGGTILDWETASVAPFGIDAGRAAFIALLDNHHTGIPEELRTAFIRGYRAGLPADMSLDDETLHAAILIAALQFTHGRHTQPLRPDRTPKRAVDALTNYLAAR